MKIVDAQVHIWRQTVSQPTGKHRKVSLVSAEQMLKEMDEAGVDAALIHPPLSWDPSSQEMALEAARKYPRRFAVMGQFDPKNPANKALIPTWRKQPGMMGLRWALADELSTGQPQAIMDRCERKATAYRQALEDWDVEDAPTSFTPDQRALYATSSFR